MNKNYLSFLLGALSVMATAQTTFNFSTANRGPLLGNRHYGIFYEEINHAGDGGIYAELVRNGSMEEGSSFWTVIGEASTEISKSNLLNDAQLQALKLNVKSAWSGVKNAGFWGMNIVKGDKYKASFWIRTDKDMDTEIKVTLLGEGNADLGSATVPVSGATSWKKYTCEIVATGDYGKGSMSLTSSQTGAIYLDCVSLFPPTFKDRENGMRKDLAEKLAALHPSFVRFPGGCYIEGGNRYQWKNTIGPVEERMGLYKSHWGYVVTNGMGFHEFLQLTEDLGAEPMFVVNMGMGHGWYDDYRHIEGYIQEALDALEYCNGDETTYWGKKRAENGHPAPFNMRMIEIGNENYNFTSTSNSDQSDHYAERYKQFYDAIKAVYPDVLCIGNVQAWGTDDPTWRNQYEIEIVDEHYYRSPDWFAARYNKYDTYSRTNYTVYVGEYAVTDKFGVNGHLRAALGEAVFMAGMERNSDVVEMTSYAPIFVNENAVDWKPDMIRYNSSKSFGTPSYWAQQMMGANVGYQNITWTEENNTDSLYICAALTEAEDTVIVKLVNYSQKEINAVMNFVDAKINGAAKYRVMTAPIPTAENSMSNMLNVVPSAETTLDDPSTYAVPAYSLTVMRIPLTDVSAEVRKSAKEVPAADIAYDFEQGKAVDVSGEYVGSLSGGAEIITLADGNKVLYTGAKNDKGYMDFGTSVLEKMTGLLNGENYTVSMDLMIVDASNLMSYCWAWNVSNGTSNYSGLINTASNNNWYFEKYYGTKHHVDSKSSLRKNEWHNITVTVESSTKAKIYVNGLLRSEVEISDGKLTYDSKTNAWLGRSPYTSDAYMTGVCFDDIEFYSETLDDQQILSLYNKAVGKDVEFVTEGVVEVEPTANEVAVELSSKGYMTDMTSLLLNADFANKKADWDGTPFTAAPGTVAEQYDKLFDTYQVLHNMPAGVYKLVWQGFYRNGSIDAAMYKHTSNTEALNAEVYVAKQKASSVFYADTTMLMVEPVMSIYDGEGYTYTPYTYPDNVSTANQAFMAGQYKQESPYIVMDEMGDMRIGIRKRKIGFHDWTCFDNFKLYYVNPLNQLGLGDLMEKSKEDNRYYSLDGRLVTRVVKGMYIKGGRLVLVK